VVATCNPSIPRTRSSTVPLCCALVTNVILQAVSATT
jgi:hypothetical protein